MCIAICKPAGLRIPTDNLEESFAHNSDGAGFMYAEDDVLHIEKGFMDFYSFYEQYEKHQDKAMAVHFRIATHGNTDEANTHPFQVGKHIGVIHNGIINKVDCKEDTSMSDTYHFTNQILVPIYKKDSRFPFKEHFKALLTEYIGYSKLVFLNNKGHYTIINEAAGQWDEGVWYSNASYKPRKTFKQAPFVPQPPKVIRPAEPEVFSVDAEVDVFYSQASNHNFKGVIKYFTGNSLIGIFCPKDNKTYTVPINFVHLSKEEDGNTLQKGDWVVRKDAVLPPDGEETVGEIIAVHNGTCVVKWSDLEGNFTGPNYAIAHTALKLWWETNDDDYTLPINLGV